MVKSKQKRKYENCPILVYNTSSSGNSLPTNCPETSIRNYHYSMRNNPDERSSHLLRGGSLKTLKHT